MLSKEEFVEVVLRYTYHTASSEGIDDMWADYTDHNVWHKKHMGIINHPFYHALITAEKLHMMKEVIEALDIKEHSHSHV